MAKRKRLYPDVKAGEWVQPRASGYRMACCDCCLVHLLRFRIRGGKVQMQAFRDNRSTAQLRRWRTPNWKAIVEP